MLFSLRLDRDNAKSWHLRLLDRISQLAGVTCMIDPVAGPGPDLNAERLLRLEALLRGKAVESPLPSTWVDRYPRDHLKTLDITLDLAGNDRIASGRIWCLVVDGVSGEGGLLNACVFGRSPIAELREGQTVIASGRIGTESNGLLLDSLQDAQARVISLVMAALSGKAPVLHVNASASGGRSRLTVAEVAQAAVRIVSNRAAGRLHRLLYQTPHWRVGWRKREGADLFELRRHPDAGWRDIPDDGLRFYADPFPILVGDVVTLFVEEYPHATRKGIISAVRFGADGPIGRPEPVLEGPTHLSYPFVFQREGDVWMVPESCEARTIDLYRATRFPGGWIKEATLVDDVEASDATLHQAEDRWWLFATVKDGGSYSDMLHLWSAPDFRGPWTPHHGNPVLIDIASARPAGRLAVRKGALYRPVQDCRDGYGAALGLARVTQLDDDGFMQETETILTAGPRWPGACLHTLNEAGGFEFIDGSGQAFRPLLRRRH